MRYVFGACGNNSSDSIAGILHSQTMMYKMYFVCLILYLFGFIRNKIFFEIIISIKHMLPGHTNSLKNYIKLNYDNYNYFHHAESILTKLAYMIENVEGTLNSNYKQIEKRYLISNCFK